MLLTVFGLPNCSKEFEIISNVCSIEVVGLISTRELLDVGASLPPSVFAEFCYDNTMNSNEIFTLSSLFIQTSTFLFWQFVNRTQI